MIETKVGTIPLPVRLSSSTTTSSEDIDSFEEQMAAAGRAERWRKLARALGTDEDALLCGALERTAAEAHAILQSAEQALEAGIPAEDVLASLRGTDDEAEDEATCDLTCVQCGKGISSADEALRKCDHIYCSEACVRGHRRDLAARAAERRLGR